MDLIDDGRRILVGIICVPSIVASLPIFRRAVTKRQEEKLKLDVTNTNLSLAADDSPATARALRTADSRTEPPH